MNLDDTIKRIKSNAAEIGSKMMTGKTIEEQVKEIVLKNSNKKVKDSIIGKNIK